MSLRFRFLAIGIDRAPCRGRLRQPRASGTLAGADEAQHHPHPGRRPRVWRSERLRPGPVRDARHRSPRARGDSFHQLLLGQHRVRAVAGGAHDGHAHRPRVDSGQRRHPAAAGGCHRSDAAARRRLSHGRHRQMGSGNSGDDRAAGQEGLRLLLRVPGPSACPSAVHRSSLPQRRARADRSQSRLRQRPVHARSRVVHHAGRPEAILPLPQLHRAACRASRARATRSIR